MFHAEHSAPGEGGEATPLDKLILVAFPNSKCFSKPQA